jgi:hypothetical protein
MSRRGKPILRGDHRRRGREPFGAARLLPRRWTEALTRISPTPRSSDPELLQAGARSLSLYRRPDCVAVGDGMAG